VLVDVLAPLVGELELGSRTFARRLDQALIDQLLQRRVDRAGARLPESAGLGLDRLDEAVPVARAVCEKQQDDGANVSLAGSAWSAVAAAGSEKPAGTSGTAPRPRGVAEAGTVMVVTRVLVVAVMESLVHVDTLRVSTIYRNSLR
jgi:hypothetical protein